MGNGIDHLLQIIMLYNAHVRVSCKSLGILYKYIFTPRLHADVGSYSLAITI